ncbi:Glycosyl hydrolases family 43 [Aquisphaera giovannonii]|uniref:Glycosyl hydrolases family 43 n=1 Tax=Aquisphaera giovannonii TaxID=406548 RepID=A0A5B9W4N3_9BACT|nr:glycoside hydrolase family 43 protein [Aquisphaera giovannonii]QEH35512.1 Glycosyl hydrolases family 43 [Aquisphaera giovannonii]
MNDAAATQARTFANPIRGVALGDPFVLRDRGRFYLYGTNDGPPLADGRAIPVYRSDDLIEWEFLGGALAMSDPAADHWAPEVLPWNGRYYMVVSFGDVVHRGHALWVAVADRPVGPFELRARVNGPDERFSIDGSWLLDEDGRLYLFRCLDFVAEDDPPHGTGIVVQPMEHPLGPAGPSSVVLRAGAPWHLFEADREMPLYGGRRFAEWTTVEGPAPVRRNGRYYCGYSGGNYTGHYGTGEAAADTPLGPYRDLRGLEGPLFATTPGLVEGPGHFSVVRPDLVHDWIVLHGRTPGEGVRRVWLCPATWGDGGVSIGALTDRPQPSPPLPTDLYRAGVTAPGSLGSWDFESGRWAEDGGELRHEGRGPGRAWRAGLEFEGDWALEFYLRFPSAGGHDRGGLVLRCGDAESTVVVDRALGRAAFRGPGGPAVAKLPTLGPEPFDMRAFHAVALTCRGGVVSVHLDRVRLFSALAVGDGPPRIGLLADGEVAFDALSITPAAS